MAYLLIYLIKSTVYLALFYAFFLTVMRGTTFFRFNRIMLLVGTFVCMFLPLYTVTVDEVEGIQLPMQVLDEMLVMKSSVETDMEIPQEVMLSTQESTSTESVSLLPYLLTGVYFTGVIVFLIAVVRSFRAVWKLIASHPKQWKDGCWLVIVPDKIPSFSWSNYVVMNQEDYENYPQVLVHERMHYLFRHSYDILFMTLVNALHWFNPMVWLIRTELKQLHEFEADEGVINQGIDATQYQILLVRKAVGKKLYNIANGFNHTKLKKRITMMIKEKSNGWERLKWLVVVPVVMGAMLVFAQPEVKDTLETIAPLENVQEDPKDLESMRNFFIEKSTAYRKYLIEQGADVKDSKDKRLTFFRVNKRNEILISDCYDLRPQDYYSPSHTDEIGPYLVQSMREARNKRKSELGKDEPRGIIFQYDATANPDSLYNYLKQIKRAYEDLRKEYPNDENLDKVCPMWVHFDFPRYFKKGGELTGKADVTILDAKDGTVLGSVKRLKYLGHLREGLGIIPNGCEIVVSLKADKDTPMGDITAIKQALRENYIYKLSLETTKP